MTNRANISIVSIKKVHIIQTGLAQKCQPCFITFDIYFAEAEKMTTFAVGKVVHDQLPPNSPRT
jgi:hypothetical protein